MAASVSLSRSAIPFDASLLDRLMDEAEAGLKPASA